MKDELSLLQAQLTYKQRLEAALRELCCQRQPLLERSVLLRQKMLREQRDVDRLENGSLAAFFYHALGKMDEKLDLERQEYYAARVKYDACMRELEAIEQDIEATREDLADLAQCEARYAAALEQKRTTIEAAAIPGAEHLLALEQRLSALAGQERELREAIEAGTAALHTCAQISQLIETAKDWSVLDLLGGGFLVDMAKHEKLDEAQKTAQELQVQLQRFNRELSDVTIRASLQFAIDSMLKFSDFFFDGLLADAAVMENIRRSAALAEKTREEILTILRRLQDELAQTRHLQSRIRQEMDALVLEIQL